MSEFFFSEQCVQLFELVVLVILFLHYIPIKCGNILTLEILLRSKQVFWIFVWRIINVHDLCEQTRYETGGNCAPQILCAHAEWYVSVEFIFAFKATCYQYVP